MGRLSILRKAGLLDKPKKSTTETTTKKTKDSKSKPDWKPKSESQKKRIKLQTDE